MSEECDNRPALVVIAKRNGELRRDYGRIIGAFLYLRSVDAAAGRRPSFNRLVFGIVGALSLWLRVWA